MTTNSSEMPDQGLPPTSTAASSNPAGSVSFKAYLMQKGNDHPKEVRRFGMEQNEVTSFDRLKKKILSIFPRLNNDLTITWKDFEGDDIIISSDDELLTALTESTDVVRRLYITARSPAGVSFQGFGCHAPVLEIKATTSVNNKNEGRGSEDSEDSEEEVEEILFTCPGSKRSWQSAPRASSVKHHPNVFCDGCNKTISSHRYKCLECPDYDLCIDCESQLMHKEHMMLRIPLTMSHYTRLNNFSKSMRHMSEALHKIDRRYKKQERRRNSHEANMSGFVDPFSNILDDYLGNIPKRSKREERGKEARKEGDKKEQKDKREKEKRFCTSTASSQGCGSSQAEATAKASTSSGSPNNSSCPISARFLGTILNALQGPALHELLEQMSPIPDQILKELSQNLGKVNLNETESKATSPTNPNAASTPNAPSANPFAAKKGATTCETDGPSSSQEMPNNSAEEPSSPPPQPSPSQPDAASGQPQSGRSSRSSSEEGDAEGWTVVDAQMKEVVSDQPSVYPQLPEVEPTSMPAEPAPIRLHVDPDINKCLVALTEMGYDAKQQIIIDLAEECKGNVNRVLNVLLS